MQLDGPWWTLWVLDLPSIVLLCGISALYLRGAALLRATGYRDGSPALLRATGHRDDGAARRVDATARRTRLFLAGIAVVALGQLSAIAALSEVLLWPHMVQHLMITVVAAPLLAAGAPLTTIRAALPPGPRRMLVGLSRRTRRWRRAIGDPPPLVLATLTHVALLWLWHVPALYEAAVVHPGVHLLEHASFLGSAVWFWSQVLATAHRHRRAQALATLCLAAVIVQGGLLGALLTFAGRPLYAAVYTGAAGFTALEDQQLAGGLMWVPPGFVYATVAAHRFVGWMHATEQDLQRRQEREDVSRTASE